MKELEYPFDANLIFEKKKKFKRALLDNSDSFIEKNIAILGGSTTGEIKNILELFLLNYGIKPSFYESEYNKYYEDAVFPNPQLEEFKPDIIYIHTTNRNIQRFPVIADDEKSVALLIEQEVLKYESIWEKLSEKYHCSIIQNNFEMPLYRLMGNKDASDIHGAVNFLTRLNMRFYEYAQTHDNFYICDINYISADYGLKEWADPFYFYLYKYALNIKAIPYLAFNVANIIKSILGKNKKGFVLDLDNTLWGGIIGEDGVDNIKLGPEEAGGQGYLEFQRYIKAHKQLGVLLCIDSKNDYENALEGLRHTNSELSPEDFAEIRANWEAKDKNFEDIAKTLDILPESLVFIDDNPAERYIVREQIPGAAVPEIEESHQYIKNIDRNGYFEVTTLSKDDCMRNEMYRENAERKQFQALFSDYGGYLASLDMKAEIKAFEPVYMARISQLTNKSNQFNLTTRRYTQAEIEKLAADKEYITLYGKLEDRFGDNGVVSVIIGHKNLEICNIELWLMSCRVLKRDMEYVMMDKLVHKCKECGIKEIHGFYYPTAKNLMVKEFYSLLGFEKVADDNGNTEWAYRIPDSYADKNKYITVKG
ncbi:MAG: HAD-IIIC family phosphatase [Butyrivibrio sp.]|nr:HAD-IIIC family phosphatase [Butyrivibrio sp.]